MAQPLKMPRMNLADYLYEKRISPPEFGRMIGVTGQAVRQWLRGETHPTAKQVNSIRRVTDGAVLPNDLFPESEAAE